jgi:hypothetical protein
MSATLTESPTTVGEPARARRSARVPAWLTVTAGLAIAAVVILVCSYPMIRGGGFIGFDWFAHLWYIWHQQKSMEQHILPTFFAQNATGVFDPHFAFYGGTLYTITGALAIAIGHEAAFVAMWIFAFMMAYGGLYWMARQAGVGPWAAHVPGIVFVSSPWYLSSIYVWGSFGQNMAFSALLLLLASAFSVVRADRLKPWPAAALALSVLLYTGSHSLTLAWASTAMAVLGVAFFALVPGFRRLLSWRGLRRVFAVAVPAGLVNAWFLIPATAYQGHTYLGTNYQLAAGLLFTSMYYVKAEHILTLTRSRADPASPHLAEQLPLLAAGWAVVGIVLSRPGLRSQWLRTGVLMLLAAIGMWVLLTHYSLIMGLPHPYDQIQAPYRLEAYVNLAVGGLLIAALVLVMRARPGFLRRWTWLMVPILLLIVVQARGQVLDPMSANAPGPQWNAPAPYLTKDVRLGMADYINMNVPAYQPDRPFTFVLFDATKTERTGRADATVDAQPGEYVQTNLKVSTPLIKVAGASIVARDPVGNAFLQIDAGAKPGAAHVVVTPAHPAPVVLGRILTLLGLLGLMGVALALFLRARGVRIRADADPSARPAPVQRP